LIAALVLAADFIECQQRTVNFAAKCRENHLIRNGSCAQLICNSNPSK